MWREALPFFFVLFLLERQEEQFVDLWMSQFQVASIRL